jgi:hypothetical protein
LIEEGNPNFTARVEPAYRLAYRYEIELVTQDILAK